MILGFRQLVEYTEEDGHGPITIYWKVHTSLIRLKMNIELRNGLLVMSAKSAALLFDEDSISRVYPAKKEAKEFQKPN